MYHLLNFIKVKFGKVINYTVQRVNYLMLNCDGQEDDGVPFLPGGLRPPGPHLPHQLPHQGRDQAR
jgi:hypothetical protein